MIAEARQAGGPAPVSSRQGRWLGVSALLHAAAVLGVLLGLPPEPPPAPPAEQGVALVWAGDTDGAADAADHSMTPAGAPAPPALQEAALTPAPAPPAAVPPPSPEAPDAPAMAIAPAPHPPSPAPPPLAESLAAALPLPPPPPPPPPAAPTSGQPARSSSRPAPRPAPAQEAAAPTPPAPRTIWSPPGRQGPEQGAEAPPQAVGAGLASGAVRPARPLSGANNPSPEYPYRSRIRGEQGSVALLVQVDPEGRVVDLSVLRSSGFPALDEAAEKAVRHWRFEPAIRDGAAVFSSATVAITFRLDGERRW